MTTQSKQLATTATARPIRVAYLVDTDRCPDSLLDAIFSEAYSRWGGRRTLIAPAKPEGIDPAYEDWLWHYDADIIYSFVPLTDAAVAAVHEKYGPAHLVYHNPIGLTSNERKYARIELPIRSLPSLSTVPAWLSRTWGFAERITRLRLIDKYFDQSESRFISENFGFLSDAFQGMVAANCSDVFHTITLIEQTSKDNPRWGKSSTAEYVTTERQILEEIANATPTLSLTVASDLFAPYLVTDFSDWRSGVSLVIGDSVDDRLLFWNQHHRHEDMWIGTITALRLPEARMADFELLGLIKKIVAQRGKLDSQSRRHITVRSCSLSQAELDNFAATLRAGDSWGSIGAVHHDTHAACVPSFNTLNEPHYQFSMSVLRTK
jgi:hypothetical protein